MPPPTPSSSTRRRWLQQAAALGLTAPFSSLALAGPGQAGGPRLLLLILRGGMDGLAAVPAPGDPAFAEARGPLGQAASPLLPLDGLFALHPALPGLHALYRQGQLLVLHATGLPYRERSHFDAQQVLESGGERPFALDTGWLGRALARSGRSGLALQPAVPLVLRGSERIDTWAPSIRAAPPPDLLARLGELYAGDAALAAALARAQALHGDATPTGLAPGPAAAAMGGGAGGQAAPVALAWQAARFLAQPDGPQAAVLALGGWDTHANQAAPDAGGPMNRQLQLLDATLATLHQGLSQSVAGDAWARSVVLVVTEFGRTVAMNGTRGTDHGSGGVALVLGGAVSGGRVLADWPGLAPKQRHDGRDLRITSDLRALFKTVLQQHLGLSPAVVAQHVLPGSTALPLLPLWRG